MKATAALNNKASSPLRRGLARLGGAAAGAAVLAALVAAGCGGGNPLDNPGNVGNPGGVSGQKLSFVYYQRCINPIFLAALPININGVLSVNTCAGAGCHDDAVGTGGAFRVVPTATAVDVATTDPAVIRTTLMYRNYFSAHGEVVLSSALQSRLLAKPMVRNILHGGGLIFEDETDPNARLIQFWITHPVPQGQDEFSTGSAVQAMFAGGDVVGGACLQ